MDDASRTWITNANMKFHRNYTNAAHTVSLQQAKAATPQPNSATSLSVKTIDAHWTSKEDDDENHPPKAVVVDSKTPLRGWGVYCMTKIDLKVAHEQLRMPLEIK